MLVPAQFYPSADGLKRGLLVMLFSECSQPLHMLFVPSTFSLDCWAAICDVPPSCHVATIAIIAVEVQKAAFHGFNLKPGRELGVEPHGSI